MKTYSNTMYQLKKLIESINVSKYTNVELEGNLSDYIKNAKEFTELSFNLLYKRDYDGQPVYSNKTINSGLEFEYKNQKNISTKEIIFKVGKAATTVDSKGNKNKIGFGGAHIADKHANDLDFMFRKLLNSSDKEIRKIINYINQISNSMNFITNEERKMFRILMWFPFALKNGQQGTKENDKNKNIDNKTYILYENSFFVLELTSSKTAFSLTTVYPASKSTKNNFKEYKPTNESLEIKQLYENAGVSLPNENSLGEKIIPDDDPVKLQNFWNWFGNSKLVDEQGRPLVVYHGSKQANIREFQSKYSDSLIFFAYKKEFSENWAKRAIVFDDQRRQIDDFHRSDEYRNIRDQLTIKYQEKYGENFTDNDEIFSQYQKEYRLIDKNFLDKIGIKETVYSVYIKANKIFNTKRDYKIILDDLDKAWKLELDADYTQELKTTLEKYNDVRNKINKWVKTIDSKHLISKDDEEINKKEAELQKELDDADENYMYWKRKESGRNEALNYIKNGYWMYFERKEIVDRIWELGYDAIELAESTMYNDDGSAPEITTIAVRPGNKQIKSVNNNGDFSMSSDNIYESGVNKTLKESLEFHSNLNNKIWNGFKLKEKVHDALYKIADVFTRSLEVPDLELEDVVITGSLCNYNYNKNSDIDLHLVVDFEKLGISPEDFVQKYFNVAYFHCILMA